MFDIWQSISELRQPCIARSMPEAFIDVNGTVKTSYLNSLDNLIWDYILDDFNEWQQPQHDIFQLSAKQKWLNISALQKAIRRGEVNKAIQYAKQGCQLDANYVFRRLAVCALEDVGIGNLLVVASCLAVLGDSRRRRKIGQTNLAAYLAQKLADSPKSRLACDMLSLVEYNSALKPLVLNWVKSPNQYLANQITNETLTIEERMLATWILAGTHRFQSNIIPRSNYRHRAALMIEMTKARIPLILYYIADRGAARTSDALFCSYLQIWNIIKREDDFMLTKHDIPKSQMIGNFPAETYDMHTREGKMAINACAINFTKLNLPQKVSIQTLQNAIFLIEGGRLNNEVTSKSTEAIKIKAGQLELGIEHELDQNIFLDEAVNLLPKLNLNRRKFFK